MDNKREIGWEYRAAEECATAHSIRMWNGEWYRWTGHVYCTVSSDAVKKLILGYLRQANHTPVNRARINCVLDAMKLVTLLEIANVPCWLTDSPPHPADEMVVAANGLIHLPTLLVGQSRLLPHTPDLFTLNALGYDYEENATCPLWKHFLSQIWPNDAQSIRTLREWFGYVLLPDTQQQKFLMLVGPPRSGKGTIAWVLRMLLGKANVASPMMRSLSGSFGLWGLVGKLLTVVPDASVAKASNSLVELVKCLTGEDALDIERKNLAPISSVQLPTRLMVIGNQPPIMIDPSGAIGHRLIALETKNSWAGKEDRFLKNKLETELPGILRWAMAGWRSLHDRGHFIQPRSSQHVVDQYKGVPFDAVCPVKRAILPNVASGCGDGAIRITIEYGGP